MNRAVLPLLLSVLFTMNQCHGLGADHKPGKLPPHDSWPEGIYNAVNQPHRVHGYWVNWSDTFFYRGSNEKLQEMAQKLSETKLTKTEVVLHAASGVAESPWSEKPVDSADWSVTVTGGDARKGLVSQIRIDIWVGGEVALDSLELPSNLKIKSGGEIESFIKKHNEPTTKDAK
ncbi:MAG: hypothetical protein AAGG48_27915 [Planctomycetota bacterium]